MMDMPVREFGNGPGELASYYVRLVLGGKRPRWYAVLRFWAWL
jgi:hypothetical protein